MNEKKILKILRKKADEYALINNQISLLKDLKRHILHEVKEIRNKIFIKQLKSSYWVILKTMKIKV